MNSEQKEQTIANVIKWLQDNDIINLTPVKNLAGENGNIFPEDSESLLITVRPYHEITFEEIEALQASLKK